jgi:hypothetical protein
VGALIERVRGHAQHPLSVFDAVFCLGATGGCDTHAHPLGIAWRVERQQRDATLQGEHRRLSGWHDALSAASARGYRHVLLLEDESGPGTVPAIDVAEWQRPWDLCLLALTSPAGVQAPRGFTTAGGLAMAGLAVAVHARAYGRILADLSSDDAGRQAFLATWPDLDTYLLQGMTKGVFTAIGEPFAEPATDRAVLAPGVQLVELASGLMVHQQTPPRVHELNNTASMVLLLCDGERTIAAVAAELAASFALATSPLAEVCACVDGLRRAGVLVVHRDASARARGSVTEYGRP